MYSFYFSFRGNKNVPSVVVYSFLAIGVITTVLWVITKNSTTLLLFISYPILFFLVKQHLQIDTEKKQYRLGVDVAGSTFGKWEPLPEIEYISVFRKQFKNKPFEDGGGLNWDDTYHKIEVNLIVNKREKMLVWIGDNPNKAMMAARYLSKHMNLKILDATRREFVWLDE
ncbi:MAG: hypothetical protein F9K23_04260 [Bacteroidetes bacterium]|nr:MAG: hypothetical protein F9K23_04260 [Bacteroidota bacterium]